METLSNVSSCCYVKWTNIGCWHGIVVQVSGNFNPSQTRKHVLKCKPVCLLQVDVLKSTALPLMKKFGIDGEGFDLKVRT